jgi:spermidine synthase
MSPLPYEELAYASTPLGEISLRTRYDRLTHRWVHEVRLGDEYLMSSQFNATEIALARLGLAEAPPGDLRVVVAGLGLGFTAHEALQDARTTHLGVIELVGAVIDWHRRELVPDTAGLAADPRCELVEADFFEVVRSGRLPDADVLLVDIDHSPEHLLAAGHGDFYGEAGLRAAADALSEHGVLALWSDDPPEAGMLAHLRTAFTRARAEVVAFDNPITGGSSSCTVYVASQPLAAAAASAST